MPRKKIPEYVEQNKPNPEVTEDEKQVPKVSDNTKPAPHVGIEQNTIQVNGERLQLKATRLKYQRDRTAAFYNILQKVPVVDILSFDDDFLDPQRSPDKMLFDWLIAVTDSPDYVMRNYDNFDSQTIERALKIFLRLNHIDERKNESKNQTAQVTNP